MPTYRWTGEDGKKYKISSESSLSDADLTEAVAGKSSPAPAAPAKVPEKNLRNTGSLLGDIAALPQRAGRLMIGKDQPQGMDDYALMFGTSLPIITATGGAATAAGAGPWAAAGARALAAGGLGKLRGESWGQAGLEAGAAGIAEGALGLIGKLGGKAATGLERVKEIIGRGKDGPVNIQGLTQKIESWLKASTVTERETLLRGIDAGAAPKGTAIEGVVPYLEKIDPRAARIFEKEVAEGFKLPKLPRTPPIKPSTSEAIRDVAQSNVTRSIADTTEGQSTTAQGLTAKPLMELGELATAPSRLIHWLPR